MLKSSSYITENVPMIDIGSVRLGISVATTLRRKRKITSTTSTSAIDQRELHVGDGVLDRERPVVLDVHLERRREPVLDLGQRILHALRDLDRVRARLPLHHQVDRPLVVEPRDVLVVLDVVEHVRDVAEPHRRAVLVRDDQLPEIGGVVQLPGRLHA